jgi:hypothetical protein
MLSNLNVKKTLQRRLRTQRIITLAATSGFYNTHDYPEWDVDVWPTPTSLDGEMLPSHLRVNFCEDSIMSTVLGLPVRSCRSRHNRKVPALGPRARHRGPSSLYQTGKVDIATPRVASPFGPELDAEK